MKNGSAQVRYDAGKAHCGTLGREGVPGRDVTGIPLLGCASFVFISTRDASLGWREPDFTGAIRQQRPAKRENIHPFGRVKKNAEPGAGDE